MSIHTLLSAVLQRDDDVAGIIGAMFAGVGFFIWLAIVVVVIAGMWKMFVKAGQPGWAAIIPIFNVFVLGKIAGWTGGKIILLFIPIINIVFALLLWLDIAKVFGKGAGFGLGLVFLPMIFLPILGFDDSRYRGSGPMAPVNPPTWRPT